MIRNGLENRGRSSGVVAGLAAALAILAVPAAAAPENEAKAAFEALENRLLEAATVELDFDIRATGAVDAALAGRLAVSSPGEAALTAGGTFAGAATDIALQSADGALHGVSGDRSFEMAAPPALQEGLLIGMTRMGLLHNLAVISAGSPPDRTDGTVRDWVTVDDLSLEEAAPIGGVPTRAFSFTVVVGGRPSAVARLWVDAATGLPIRRTQTVSFPEGEMRVLEQYPAFRLAQPD